MAARRGPTPSRRRAWRLGAVLAAASLCLAPPLAAQEAVPEPEGYRMEEYRAPVPETLAGATVLDTERAHGLWSAGDAVFVDVLPQPGRPAELPKGTLWRPAQRDDIPGSLWLPNTGHGALSPEAESYFAGGLDAATRGDRDAPVVFYCKAECWMSWNAAKRAMEMGYADVSWYPEGTDGWSAAGHPTEPREPVDGAPGA